MKSIYFSGYVTSNTQFNFLDLPNQLLLPLPIARLPTATILSDHKFYEYGLYYGWAKLSFESSYNVMIMNVTYDMIIEIHILNEYQSKFYDTSIDLIISGLIPDTTDDYLVYARRMLNHEKIFC